MLSPWAHQIVQNKRLLAGDVLHRDLKALNVLLNSDMVAKVQ